VPAWRPLVGLIREQPTSETFSLNHRPLRLALLLVVAAAAFAATAGSAAARTPCGGQVIDDWYGSKTGQLHLSPPLLPRRAEDRPGPHRHLSLLERAPGHSPRYAAGDRGRQGWWPPRSSRCSHGRRLAELLRRPRCEERRSRPDRRPTVHDPAANDQQPGGAPPHPQQWQLERLVRAACSDRTRRDCRSHARARLGRLPRTTTPAAAPNVPIAACEQPQKSLIPGILLRRQLSERKRQRTFTLRRTPTCFSTPIKTAYSEMPVEGKVRGYS
jgi:hypothetical protein